MATEQDDNPLEQLLELLVYAPIGLLYEYPDVIPQLVKRGKSQVQLAKFAGQVALKQQQQKAQTTTAAEDNAANPLSAEVLAEGLARLITDVGSMIGLAPNLRTPGSSKQSVEADRATTAPKPEPVKPERSDPAGSSAKAKNRAAAKKPVTAKLPIANYDKLTAKQVIFLLEDLTESQLQRVHQFEKSNRNRKTVLSKIDRLLR